MSQSRVVLVTADTGNLDELLARVRAAGQGGAPVALLAPPESSLFLTVREFQLLRDTIDRERLHLRFFTDDPLRARLAGLHGIEPAKIPASLRIPRPPRPASTTGAAQASAGSDAAGVANANRTPRTADTRAGARAADASRVVALPDRDPRSRPAPFAPPHPPASSRENNGAGGSVSTRSRTLVAPSGPGPAAPVAADPGNQPRPTTDAAGTTAPAAAPAAVRLKSTVGGAAETVALAGAAKPGSPTSPVGTADVAGPGSLEADSPAKTGADQPDGQWPAVPGIPDSPEPSPTPFRKSRFGRVRRDPARAEAADETVADPSGTAAVAPDADLDAKPLSIAPASERKRSLPRWLGLGLLIAVVAGIGVLAFQALTPRAEIRISLERQAVAQTVMFDVTADGKPLDDGAAAAVPARAVEFPVTFSASIPVTGTRLDPVGTASGPVRFANPTVAEITVPAGTVLTNGAGTRFLLNEAVSVPAADAATGGSGQEIGQMTAEAAGGAGDTEPGEVGGRLESGVYYSNRDGGTSGGEDREIPVVAEADLTALKDQAGATIAASAATEAAKQVPAGDQLIPESVAVVARADEPDAAAGDAVETVTLKSTATIRALVYDPAEAMLELRSQLPEILAASAPAGYAIDPATVRFGAEKPVSGQATGARIEVPVQSEAVAVMDEARERVLAAKLAGLSAAEAEHVLQSEPGITGADVRYSPGWLTRGMPGDPGRITIDSGT